MVEKDRRNFCEYFSYSREPFAAAGAGASREAAARKRLEGLFKKPGVGKPGAGGDPSSE